MKVTIEIHKNKDRTINFIKVDIANLDTRDFYTPQSLEECDQFMAYPESEIFGAVSRYIEEWHKKGLE